LVLWGYDDFRFFNESISKVNGSVGDRGQRLVVRDDDKGLAKLIAKVKEKFVEFFFVL
jgi:hypothetical protein